MKRILIASFLLAAVSLVALVLPLDVATSTALGFAALGATFYENLKGFIGDGGTLKTVAPSGGSTSGVPFLLGGRLVIAMSTQDEAATLMVCTKTTDAGYIFDKEAPLVITAGDDLFWDDTAKKLTKTATDNTWMGVAVESAASAATTVRAQLIEFQPDAVTS